MLFSCKMLFNMTQLASSKNHRSSGNDQSSVCMKAAQAIVCGSRRPGSVKQATKGSIDLAMSVLQKARPAVSVFKRNISVPRAFTIAEGGKRLSSRKSQHSPQAHCEGPHHYYQPCTGISPVSPSLGAEVASPGCSHYRH